MVGGVDLERYKAIDFGKLALHWLLTILGVSTAFGIQYTLMENTYSDGTGFLPVDIYAVNKPLFIIGALIIAVGYMFVWKLWLKRDLIRCIQCHWGWVVMYSFIAAWNLFLVLVSGLVTQLFRLPSLFSAVDGIAEIFPIIVVGYMILFPVIESLITGLKRKV